MHIRPRPRLKRPKTVDERPIRQFRHDQVRMRTLKLPVALRFNTEYQSPLGNDSDLAADRGASGVSSTIVSERGLLHADVAEKIPFVTAGTPPALIENPYRSRLQVLIVATPEAEPGRL